MPVAALIRLLLGLLAPVLDRRRITATIRRGAVAAALVLLAALALLAAIGLTGAALWAIAAPALGPAGASLMLAGVFVTLALFLLLGAWLAMNAKRKRQAPTPAGTDPVEAMLAAVQTLFAGNMAALPLAALVAGVLAERRRTRE